MPAAQCMLWHVRASSILLKDARPLIEAVCRVGSVNTLASVPPSTSSSMMVMVCSAASFWALLPKAFSNESRLPIPSRGVAAMYTRDA